jgi:hypothetical protein
MKSLRKPVVYQGVTYSEYEIDFYTSQVYSVKSGKSLRNYIRKDGYFYIGPWLNYRKCIIGIHTLMGETFCDLLPKSPLVSYYDLQIGRNQHTLKTSTGFNFICNMVCPDHIDRDTSNNHHSNLMIVTQLENNLKRIPKIKAFSPYKGVTSDRGKFKARIETKNTIDKNGKPFRVSKNSKTEKEAALVYNKILEESLFTIWGKDLGLKLYDLAYKNVIEIPC